MVGSIVVVLLAVLMPTVGYGLERAKSFKCQSALRAIAFDFAVFANDDLHGDRGDDRVNYGARRFSLETFVESQYGVDEFWAFGDVDLAERPDERGDDPMRCSKVSGAVSLRANTPCREGAVGPTQHVSFGFNMRLWKAETVDAQGRPRVKEVQMDSSILGEGRVPLVWDVDGERAARADAQAMFSAPSLDSAGPYAGDVAWFPGLRHLRAGHFAFVDGSVRSSGDPLSESGWDWGFQPTP